MNIHEYQAKELLAHYGIPVTKGICVDGSGSPDLTLLPNGSKKYVVKAQIHAGGRSRGRFKENGHPGVRMVDSLDDAVHLAHEWLGKTLITRQTGAKGQRVNRVYISAAAEVSQEFYLALLVDRQRGQPLFLLSAEGGVDIETLAQEAPEKILRVPVDPLLGLPSYRAREAAFNLDLGGKNGERLGELLERIYNLFDEREATLIEINPLVLKTDGQWECLDAKIQLDDNALFRQPENLTLRDPSQEDPQEVQASQFGLNYVALEGDIACLVNGAGLAMATMDLIHHFGGQPANFLDVGGGARPDQIREAFRILLNDPKVRGIFVNIFGGILRCDLIAHGILEAATTLSPSVPIVVRLQGTNAREACSLLETSSFPIVGEGDLAKAAQKIVELAS
jgi:succinyl-CoA synthetase beta subunit